MRVGIALQSPNALDAVAFWLSEWLEGRSIVLFDSPTLVAVGLSTEGYYRELTGDAPPIFDYLKNYDESAQSVANRVRQRIQRASPNGRDLACLFVNSLHSSGRLARRVAQGLSAVSEISSLSNVSLFAASSGEKGAVDGEVFSELEQRFLRHSAAACPRCQDGSHVVGIEHRSYLLELAAASETARINIKDAQPVRDFLDRYAGIDAISLHRDRHDGARHHGIHIDVKPLLKSPSFRARLQEKTQPLNQAVDVIVAPNHKGAIALAKMVKTKLKARLIVCDERDLASLPAHDKTSIRRARGLLIVDDVLVTGHRLRGYKNFLQRSALIGQSTLVGALVAVERPINRQELRGIRDCFFGALGLIGVESILLPDWDKPDCPWCIEYERWNAAIRNRRDVTARHTLLADTRKGLADDAFLGWSKTSRRHLRLGPQSIFGRGLNQAEIMTAVAGALQELRDSGKLNDRPVTPVAKLLHPGFYLTGRYYDPVILAAVLRCCQRHDLYATATEKSVRRALMSHLDRTANDAAWGEVLLAIGIGKLPKVELASTRARRCRGETARLLKHLFSSNPMEPLATSN